jgi:hypothetical protein
MVAKHASMYLHKFIIRRPEFPDDIPEALRQVSEQCLIRKVKSSLDLLLFNTQHTFFILMNDKQRFLFSFIRDLLNTTMRFIIEKKLLDQQQSQC